MPLIFSAICPHPPLLISSADKAVSRKLLKTKKAVRKLEEDLYSSKPDILLILSPHGRMPQGSICSINQSPLLKSDFMDFGDLQTKLEYNNNLQLAYRIRESAESSLALSVSSESRLDYGTAIALKILTNSLKNFSVVSINIDQLKNSCQSFGEKIRKIIDETNMRVAAIASCNLSHYSSNDSKNGRQASAGKKFDSAVLNSIKENQPEKLKYLDAEMINDSCQCGLEPIKLLYNILGRTKITPDVLCYQKTLNVGYLTAELII